jgi:2,3-bisphosphoglycerate-dependent phosphoglycerate mutase
MSENSSLYYIILLRHAESVGNAGGYHQGQAEFPLTERGREQAHALAAYWETNNQAFDHCLSSPQSRARETAEIIASRLNLEIEFDTVWMERDNGVYAGLHQDEAQEQYPYPDFQPLYERVGQTGESEWELYLRGARAVQSILHRGPGHYLVVSHGAILNMVMRALMGITPQANFQGVHFRFRNSAYAKLSYRPEIHRWNLYAVNQRPHWQEDA